MALTRTINVANATYKISNNLLGSQKICQYFYGLYIGPNKGETVRQTIERCFMFSPPAVYPVLDLMIKEPCGNEITYKTLDDIPTTDTHCPCGNPNHYYVKIGELF